MYKGESIEPNQITSYGTDFITRTETQHSQRVSVMLHS